ncbi:MAG TPA: aldehyde dehydrogenase, partial [Alphaproteobacteria bacterium]|nr:aldehyde dehydrogenase [Alphaproteobacteria bacterium]
MAEISCISPIDGAVVAVRQAMDAAAATATIKAARATQTAWAARPLDERIALVNAGVKALGAANDEIVPELARMMGRPVRYGGEFGG